MKLYVRLFGSPQTFTRQKALPSELVRSEAARVSFAGCPDGRKRWVCQRVELNAFSAPDLVAYLEQQLQRAGVRSKVIPSSQALPGLVTHAYQRELDTLARQALTALLETETLVAQVVSHFTDRMPLDDARTWLEEALAATPTLAWDRALAQKLVSLTGSLWDEVWTAVRAALRRVVQKELAKESADDDAVC
jgi:hypothetical protein